MGVTEIIQAVEKLSPVDRAKVADVLTRPDPSTSAGDVAERQTELHLQLIKQGVLKSVPDRSLVRRDFKRIKIKGKPLSETIIEERR